MTITMFAEVNLLHHYQGIWTCIVQSARIVHGWSGGQAVQRFKSYPIASWHITIRVFGLKSMFLFFDKLL